MPYKDLDAWQWKMANDFKYLPGFLSVTCLDFVDCVAITSVTYENYTFINHMF